MQKIIKIYADSFKGLSLESWMLSIVMLINRTGSMVLPFLGVYMIDHLGFSIEVSGMVLACFGVGSVLGSWLGGMLTDKLGEYYVQVFSLFISVPLFCLYPLFDSPIALGLMVFIQSVVSELFRPANSVAIAKYAKPENLTRAFSLNRMAVNLGFSFGPALGGILSTISYNFLFYINALMVLIAAFVFVYFFRRRHRLYQIKAKRKAKDIGDQEIVKHRELSPYRDWPFIVFCIFCAVLSICFFQLMSTVPMFYKDGLGLSQMVIGFLMGANGFTVVLFEMLLVHIAEKRWRLKFTLLLGTIFCAISYFLLAFDPGYILLFASIMMLSIGEILVLPFMATVTANRAGEWNKGAYMGMNGIAFSLAFIVAPILGSRLTNVFGYSNLWLGTALVLMLCAFAFYWCLPLLDRKKKEVM